MREQEDKKLFALLFRHAQSLAPLSECWWVKVLSVWETVAIHRVHIHVGFQTTMTLAKKPDARYGPSVMKRTRPRIQRSSSA